jgi:hypothetical protein
MQLYETPPAHFHMHTRDSIRLLDSYVVICHSLPITLGCTFVAMGFPMPIGCHERARSLAACGIATQRALAQGIKTPRDRSMPKKSFCTRRYGGRRAA